MNQRGFVLVEFVIALPILIFLIYALGSLTLQIAEIAREQIADYVLETEAQKIITSITEDARTAYRVEIKSSQIHDSKLENIIFICRANSQNSHNQYFNDIWIQRIYAVDSAGSNFTNRIYKNVYFKRTDDNNFNNPLTGKNDFGNTDVVQLSYSEEFLNEKVLHVTFELQRDTLRQNDDKPKVKFTTAVYMPMCKKIIYKGKTILDE